MDDSAASAPKPKPKPSAQAAQAAQAAQRAAPLWLPRLQGAASRGRPTRITKGYKGHTQTGLFPVGPSARGSQPLLPLLPLTVCAG
jgi:hypothetical protein